MGRRINMPYLKKVLGLYDAITEKFESVVADD
jgi:hypothetical protein